MPTPDAVGGSSIANILLAMLPRAEYDGLADCLEPAHLTLRQLLFDINTPIEYVYFPSSGVASLLSPPDNGDGVGIEVGLVGREGMVGLPVFLDSEAGRFRCIVQLAGDGLRMRAQDFRARVQRGSALHQLLLRYTHTFLTQIAQTLACNSRHAVEQRLCRWLLMMQSRAGSDQFQMTHEFLSAMLGVRRASVTEAARKLKTGGAINYERGALTVLDRGKLETSACSCYLVAQQELNRLFAQA
jgi:CRP-like cAMP-binding protein